ncbi:type II secretion system F family protein [Nocardioides sp. NPDC051685]|uniref:type II secretion system F family protein n=1 Tax=Nocardioides sp. NPDC051685 TaxID=3364334 RepID=UPI0037956DED
MSVLTLGVATLAVAIAFGVIGLSMVWGPANRRVAKGLESIELYYGSGQPGSVAGAGQVGLPYLLIRLGQLAAKLSPAGVPASIGRRLNLAGNPGSWTVEKVLAYKGLGLFAGAALGALLGSRSGVAVFVFGGLGAAVGFFLPDVLLYNAGSKRQAVMRKQLPNTLDMLTVCVEAGLGFDAALSQIGRNTQGPMAAECVRMLQEMQLGKSRVEALRALADRTTVVELRAFVSAMVQASELGVPTAQVLHEQAKEMRAKHRQLAEEKAQKLPVKILFPMMFCIFPVLFIVVLGPTVLSLLAMFGG